MKADDHLEPFRSAALGPLWQAARVRLEGNGGRLTSAPLRLRGLQTDEVEAICGLLGRRRPSGADVNVDLRVLDRTLRATAANAGLVEVLGLLGGPLRDRKAERTEAAMSRSAVWIMARSHPAGADDRVPEWLESVRRSGRLTRLGADDPEQLLGQALDGVEWLLVNGETMRRHPLPLSMIAAVQYGDAHTFDPDTALGALIVDALQSIAEVADERSAWAAFGIQLDQVNTSALVLGLPGIEGSIGAAATLDGQPLRITRRMIDRGFGLDLEAIRDGSTPVWICENPAVVSVAADQIGRWCAPLVCTEGMPAAVTASLLDLLSSVHADLRVHTDFDVGGMAIARYIIDRVGAAPWNLGRASYLRAIDGPTCPLGRSVGPTPWDPALSAVMEEHRLAVHEESVVHELLHDLDQR